MQLEVFPFVLSFFTGDNGKSEMVLFQDIWNCHYSLCRNAGATCSWASHLLTSFGATTTAVIVEKSTDSDFCEICLYRAIMGEGSEGSFKRISSSPFVSVCRESFHCPVREEWGWSPGLRVQLQLDEKQYCFPWPHFKGIVTAATLWFLPVRSPWFSPSLQHFPLCSGKLFWRADRLPWASQPCEEKTRHLPGNTWFMSAYPAKVISPKCWPKATSGRQLHCCYNWAYLIPSDQYLIYHHRSSALKYWA